MPTRSRSTEPRRKAPARQTQMPHSSDQSPDTDQPDDSTGALADEFQAGSLTGIDPTPADVVLTTFEQRDIPSFSDSRETRIAEAAYWRAEQRGFEPGHELDDWLEAERDVEVGDQKRTRDGR